MEQIVLNQKLANIGINAVIRHRLAWLAIILVLVILCGLGLNQLRLDLGADQITIGDGLMIGVMALAAVLLLLSLLVRSPVGMAAPLMVMLSANVILFGSMGWLGIPVSLGSLCAAPWLMVLAVSYSIHFINHFNFYFRHKGERLRALHYAYGQSFWPGFLTAATTAIVFASFQIVSLKPIRDAGIACGTGTLLSFVLVIILVPIFYSFGKETGTIHPEHSQPKQIFPWGMVPLARFVLNAKLPAIVIALGCGLFGIIYGLRIPVATDLLKLLLIGQLESLGIVFIALGLVMVLVLKSPRAGVISLIPTILPFFVIAGMMGLLQINLDWLTIMIVPTVLGIAVDTTVHFFIHFQAELLGFQDYEKANRQTFIKIGHALIFKSVVLTLGFGILGFSQVNGIETMGLLAAAGILSALLATIFLSPVLLVYLKPFGSLAPEPTSMNR